MASMRVIPIFIGSAVTVLLGLILWSIRRVRTGEAISLTAEDWTANMLTWLLVLAGLAAGVFILYTLGP